MRPAAFFLAAVLALATSAAGAVTAGLAPSQLSDGTPVDTSPVGNRIPLLLVHGMGGGPTGFDEFLRAYVATPAMRVVFKPYSYAYQSSASDVLATPGAPRTMTGLGAQMRDFVQQYYDLPTADGGFGGKSLVILAHSMGGLVARSMMQEYTFRDGRRGGERVLHLVTLGTPHQGSPMADAAFSVGLPAVDEFAQAYASLVADQAWTNFDRVDMGSGRCNPWLAKLNHYAPLGAQDLGPCGMVPANALPGFYEKIVAYGARTLQTPDIDIGLPGVYKPGSTSAFLITYGYMRSVLSGQYPNDGAVPMTSATFDGAPVAAQREAFSCDHRYLEHGYAQKVRAIGMTINETAFCSASTNTNNTSGKNGGYAVAGTIYGAAGGILDIIKTDWLSERVLDWAEQAYTGYLQPARAVTGNAQGFAYRFYPQTGAYVGVKDGGVFYMGPATNGVVTSMGSLTDFAARAQAAGF
jgi:triacylglycerol esterase/lipase EstA (alpha/beta hydrolase family)